MVLENAFKVRDVVQLVKYLAGVHRSLSLSLSITQTRTANTPVISALGSWRQEHQ